MSDVALSKKPDAPNVKSTSLPDSAEVRVWPQQSIVTAVSDIKDSLSNWRLAFEFSKEDLKQRYYRTLIGPLWIATAFIAFIIVKIYIFSSLNDADWEFFAAYLTIGYMVWVFVSSAIQEATGALTSNRSWILGMKCDYFTFILQTLFRTVMTSLITAVSALLVSYFIYPYSMTGFALAMLGFVSLIPFLLFAQLVIAVLCVFFRDVAQLIHAVMRIMFFLTPIVWLPSMLGDKADILKFNPFTHLLAIVRNPLLGETVTLENWIWVGGLTSAAICLSLTIYPFAINRIARHV